MKSSKLKNKKKSIEKFKDVVLPLYDNRIYVSIFLKLTFNNQESKLKRE